MPLESREHISYYNTNHRSIYRWFKMWHWLLKRRKQFSTGKNVSVQSSLGSAGQCNPPQPTLQVRQFEPFKFQEGSKTNIEQVEREKARWWRERQKGGDGCMNNTPAFLVKDLSVLAHSFSSTPKDQWEENVTSFSQHTWPMQQAMAGKYSDLERKKSCSDSLTASIQVGIIRSFET